MRGEIKKIAAFLNQSPTEEQFIQLLHHLNFENFAKNDAVNFEMPKKFGFMNVDGHFIRKGMYRLSATTHVHQEFFKCQKNKMR